MTNTEAYELARRAVVIVRRARAGGATMTLTNLNKTPWPWFGGKSDAAPAVWEALGDVEHYVEPFAGSLAVLMRRPLSRSQANGGGHVPVA